jgi:hypothetical protein
MTDFSTQPVYFKNFILERMTCSVVISEVYALMCVVLSRTKHTCLMETELVPLNV